MGDAPYTSATVALLESDLPGGHSPGYFAVINTPTTFASMNWRGDPASFEGFPQFFLAHELAHQWWGQAIGWKNYHEQWISEGFAQYFAALYAQRSRGDRVFFDMLRQFRRWSLSESDQGPVHLGSRLGHVKRDPRVFRALVYNKGAAVLHMLRRLLGDEVFFRGLRRFYMDRRYQKAGTEDFERAMEAESGRVLDRFFERWIYGGGIPRVRYGTQIGDKQVVVKFEQAGDQVFDIPVTVTLTYADGRTSNVVVPISDSQVERSIPTEGSVRRVQINQDSAALAEFVEG
jgi:aminopeptidase N